MAEITGNGFTGLNRDNALENSLKRFDGLYTNVYKDSFITGNSYIFITKPLLFINPLKDTKTNKDKAAYLNMTRDPLFVQYISTEALNEVDRYIPQMLSYNLSNSNVRSWFMPIFTNSCKSFDSNDTTLEQTEAFDTKQGYREVLPSHKTASEAANSLSITVTEDNNLTFTKIMSIWVNYISNITDGTFEANPDMIKEGALDYMSSIYYFVLDPDGRTIKYWCKYTGCWPTAIPYGSLRYSKGDNSLVDLNLSFAYTTKEDMNPAILEDFNRISMKVTTKVNTTIEDYYNSFVESSLLNKNVMSENLNGTNLSLLEDEDRDPVVFYRDNGENKHFELIFGKSAYHSDIKNNTLDDNNEHYYYNTEDIVEGFVK